MNPYPLTFRPSTLRPFTFYPSTLDLLTFDFATLHLLPFYIGPFDLRLCDYGFGKKFGWVQD
ncbi:MAG: hypothetical protein AAGL29_06105, partial [Bacteroidota bacterium]